jgi:hypothetical protein
MTWAGVGASLPRPFKEKKGFQTEVSKPFAFCSAPGQGRWRQAPSLPLTGRAGLSSRRVHHRRRHSRRSDRHHHCHSPVTTRTITTPITASAPEAAGAWWTRLYRAGIVHGDAAPARRLSVHAVDRRLRLGVAAHLDKAKAFGAARVALHHDLGAGNRLRHQLVSFYSAVHSALVDLKFFPC